MRPADLARGHGISTQAVRNYERDGFIPPAERTPNGYRIYTEVHAAALRSFLALVRAYGHAPGGQIMQALNVGDVDRALLAIDRGHAQLLRDRETLDSVRAAVGHLAAGPGTEPTSSRAAGSGTEPTPSRAAGPGTEPTPSRAAGPGTEPTSSRAAGPRTEPTPSRGADVLTVGELARRLGVTPATLRNWEAVGILIRARDPLTGVRRYRATDVRDADLAHLLRRGGYLLDHISTVVHQIRTAGGTDALAGALHDWQLRLTARGLAMLDAATQIGGYLAVRDQAVAGRISSAAAPHPGAPHPGAPHPGPPHPGAPHPGVRRDAGDRPAGDADRSGQ